MDVNEAKKLFDNSLRCLAISMNQIRYATANVYINYSQPLFDHLEYCTRIDPGELSDSETCLRFLNVLNSALDKAVKHEAIIEEDDTNERLYMVADMIAGHICIEYPQNLLTCAKAVMNLSSFILDKYRPREKTKDLDDEILDDFLDNVSDLLVGFGYEKASKKTSDQMRYLYAWMERNIHIHL